MSGQEHSAENDRRRSGEFVRLDTAEKYLARALAAEDAIAALVPGLRAEAERLRGINVLSVALWMDAEADRLDRVTSPEGGDQ